MFRSLLSVSCLALAGWLMHSPTAAQELGINQALELRTYTLVDEASEAKLDAYLEHALLPALTRLELGPIGVFAQAPQSEQELKAGDAKPAQDAQQPREIQVLLLIPGASVAAVTGAAAQLAQDERYQTAAADYLNTPAAEPLVKRIRSELLMSFNCWPTVIVPKQKREEQPRLFEMRVYESPTEKLGDLKVEMFNAGEVPIFLDCGIAPVFMGNALIGDRMPNLTYMTVYNNDEERQAAWKAFVAHPDWQVLKAVEKYQGTVSKIEKSDWLPKPYSQL